MLQQANEGERSIIYRNLNAAGMIFVIPGGRFEAALWDPNYCDYNVPQYYSWDQTYSGCVGGSYNTIAYANALQIGSPDPCPPPSYHHGAGLRDSLRLTGWPDNIPNGEQAYHGGPGCYVHYGWPKAKIGAGYGTYGTLYTNLSDTVVWQTAHNGWNNYQTSIRIQDIRKAYIGKPGVHLTYDAVREAWSIRGRPTQNLDGGAWPANSLGFMTVPTNDNVAKWTRWLFDEGYGAIMLYGMYPDGGYTSGADYYQRTGARHVLESLAVPTLIITAQDDPFIPYAMFTGPLVQRHPQIRIIAPRHGGHCGFLQRARNGEDAYWAENRIVDFVLERT